MKPGVHFSTALVCSSVVLAAACSAPQYSSKASGITPSETSFARDQLRHARVRNAREDAQERIEKMFADKDISYPAAEMYIRVFKMDKSLEVWVRPNDKKRFELLKTYDVCAMSGVVGPKNRRGDKQVPEGFYSIDAFNPVSTYHLSLGVDYPNKRDLAHKNVSNLGGDIFIHGGCRSDGCVAITDEAMNELYWLAVEARGLGQQRIPVHIFPARFDDAIQMRILHRSHGKKAEMMAFWQTLKPGYEYFQKKRVLPNVIVDGGNYRVADASAIADGERAERQ